MRMHQKTMLKGVNIEKDDPNTKANAFASLMDPLMISSLNYFSTLTPVELHNCVTLHKKSVVLMSADGNTHQTYINKKQKQNFLIIITKFHISDFNLNNHYRHYLILARTKVNKVKKTSSVIATMQEESPKTFAQHSLLQIIPNIRTPIVRLAQPSIIPLLQPSPSIPHVQPSFLLHHPALENAQESLESTSPNHDIDDDNSSVDNIHAHLCMTIAKLKLKILQEKSKIANKLKKMFKTKQTSFSSPLSRSFIATCLSSTPGLSHSSATALFAYIVQSLIIEVGLNVSPDEIVAACPGKDTFAQMLQDELLMFFLLQET